MRFQVLGKVIQFYIYVCVYMCIYIYTHTYSFSDLFHYRILQDIDYSSIL